MNFNSEFVVVLLGFGILSLASGRIGHYFARIKFPLISGFLATGILVGPYVLGFIQLESLEKLRFIDEVSLSFIALAAGSELYLKELRDRLKSIRFVTTGLVISTFLLGSVTLFLLADFLPFMKDLPASGKVAISILAGAILVARSPSSAIAIVKELRARGPFIQTVLGVTVIMDAVVIILFAVNSELSRAILSDVGINPLFVLTVAGELAISLAGGYILGRFICSVLSLPFGNRLKTAVILLAGYSVFILSGQLEHLSKLHFFFELSLEPLLICMIAGFIVSNNYENRDKFLKILEDTGPLIYIVFFTLTGASLALDVLTQVWQIAFILFGVRLIGIFLGSFTGGVLVKDPMAHNRISWMAYVTQAGVGLGLAKDVALGFPEWGQAFATLLIAVIILNQIAGPPMLKWAIHKVGEAHDKASMPAFDGIRDAYIFGLNPQSVTLARQLQQHNWQAKIITRSARVKEDLPADDIVIEVVHDLSLEVLKSIKMEAADAVISFLPDAEGYDVFELIYEHYGIETTVHCLEDRKNHSLFSELGVHMVEPGTAFVSLLEHYVRSPAGTSILLGMNAGQDMTDVVVSNPNLHGILLREMRLPLDVLVLSIRRKGHSILPGRATRLRLKDKLTIVGPQEKLDEVLSRFDA
ncbi:MAG: potassium transporter TrkA [FCB group bacterium]|nr:potassium transporter TrkA [FCB group bacterium]